MGQTMPKAKSIRSRRSKTRARGTGAFDRGLPQSLETEAALLGSILFDHRVLVEVADTVAPEHFYVPANQAVAQAIWDLWSENEPVDAAVIYELLCKRKQDELIGGHEGLMRLADSVPEASHAAYYASIVKGKAVLRNLITACQESIAEAYEASEEVDTILDRSEGRMFQVAHQSSTAAAAEIGSVLRDVMKIIDETPHERLVTGLATGYYELDEMTSGLQNSELIVLAARPSMGKTTLALNIAEHIALEEKKPVVVFSLETSAERIARNMLCAHAGINAHKLRTGYLPSEEYRKLNMAVGALSEAKIYIDDSATLTPFQLKAKARRLKAKHDIRFVIVDYLQLMDSPKAESRQMEITYISRQLKALAKELNIPVLAVSQLSRAVESREGNRPRLSDLRESGAIEQDADLVMMLYRADYYQPDRSRHNGEAEVIIAKQRNGPTGTIKLGFFKEYLRFGPLAKDSGTSQYEEEAVGF